MNARSPNEAEAQTAVSTSRLDQAGARSLVRFLSLPLLQERELPQGIVNLEDTSSQAAEFTDEKDLSFIAPDREENEQSNIPLGISASLSSISH